MKPFFSIVIPCCNVGKYLRECLESITKQSFENWECLCVIEDSTDDTEAIVREFSYNDQRIRVFTQPRSGSAARPRNVGIDNAIGKYIIFCDGDDSIAENSLTKLAKHINEHPDADIYASAVLEYMDGGEYIRTIDNFLPNAPAELSGHDAVLLLYNYWRNPDPMLPANIWRRDFLNEHHLRCIPGLKHDDHEFFPRGLFLAQKIVPTHEPYYLYRRQNTSITMAASSQPWYFNKYMAVILKSLFAFHASESRKNGFDKQVSRCWSRQWIGWIVEYWFCYIDKMPKNERLKTFNDLFSDGFDNFKLLSRFAPPAKRIVAFWIFIFARFPHLRWIVDIFFRTYRFIHDIQNDQYK